MGEKEERHTHAPPSGRKILALLEGLKDQPAGRLLYQQVERLLLDSARACFEVERAYASVLGVLFDAVAKQLPAGDPLRIQTYLVQRLLTPPLLGGELRSLRHCVEQWETRLQESPRADDTPYREAVASLLRGFGASDEAFTGAAEAIQEQEPPPQEEHAERQVDLVYRHHLDEQSRGIQKLQAALGEQLQDARLQQEEFSALLTEILTEMRDLEDIGVIAESRKRLSQDAERLSARNRDLTARLDSSYQTLQKIADDSRSLGDELSRVRQLSLTDDLTRLPNRRAFQRRLEDEVGRVSRYGHTLTLALIDLDNFKKINDSFGHAAGDQVLTAYASQVLSVFRHHDMVARYGGEEFAVLMPNTNIDGALRALTKVRAQVPETVIHIEGQTLKVPTFSAGIAVYHPGETADSYVSRADAALYEAKRMGRDRIEVAAENQASVRPAT